MLSPMMQQYMDTKKEYSDCILFYRLGDFYEMFFDDAKTVAQELELTLTGKDCGLAERAPMCGVPYHSVDPYISRLIEKGYKVAIAEQMEDPKLARGLVKREVIRVVTPGTVTGENSLDERRNNYLCSIAYISGAYGICFADITTGDFRITQADTLRQLEDELTGYAPAEIIYNQSFVMSGADVQAWREKYHIAASELDGSYFSDETARRVLCGHFKAASLQALGLEDCPSGTLAAGAAMQYIYDTQKHTCENITGLTIYSLGGFMIVDASTRRNLELSETMRSKDRRGSLLWVLDRTQTAMGARMLRSWLEKPLIKTDEINRRLDAVDELLAEFITREELREYLHPVYDLERLMGRVSSGSANPRDLISLKTSLSMLGPVKTVLERCKCALLKELCAGIDTLDDITSLLDASINDDPPMLVREGGIIKDGYNEEVDRLRAARTNGKTWLAQLESKERQRTGIKTLRVKYNKVFGYYLEVTNSFKDLVPADYIRKQTLVGAERYTTDELKELEATIVGAEDRLSTLEYDLFTEVRRQVAGEVVRIQASASAVAATDVLASLAQTAYAAGYVRPHINRTGVIDIKAGRHPVIERMIGEDKFIANDTYLDSQDDRVNIITGPNMAGKSTYMRQVALIVLMAQMGSFVPAASADIGICDRIFTRVGASDDLASGQSTFMVEMTEVANILRNATKNSLIIMDEIGRGTSTFDGLSIAWAVVEHIADKKILGAKTLFATHYHELTELEGILDGVHNYCVAVREQGDDIIFLRKIVKGGADKSYGVQVARLAGLPASVLARAKELLTELSGADIAYKLDIKKSTVESKAAAEPVQMSLFAADAHDDIICEIEGYDLSAMTPIDALNRLYELQKRIADRK